MTSQKYLKNGEVSMKIKNDKIIIQVICALVAVGLWVLVMIDKNPMGEKPFYRIPVTIKNVEALTRGSTSYMLMENKDSFTVNVKVKGLYNDLLKLQAKDIKATAEITDFKEGLNSLVVEVEIPNNDMKVDVISPKNITCTIDQIVSVSVDVLVQYQGVQASGFHLEYGASNPDSVIVKGPRSIVNSVSSAIAVVNVEGMQENVVQNKPVVLYDNTNKEIDTKFLTISPSSVEASYDILPTKTVPVKPVFTGEPAEGYKLTDLAVDMKNVEIAAPKEILDTIVELETEPIDITDASLNVMSEKKIVTGKNVKIVGKTNKANVTATIEEIVDKEFVFDFSDIEFANKGDDYTITPIDEDQKITVTIKATSTIMNKINKENIKLVVDLMDSVEGLNEILLSVTTDSEVESLSSDTEYVKFNLEKSKVE